MRIGIIGAGFVGKTLTQAAVQNGHEVMISNSRAKETLFSHGHLLSCLTGSASEAAAFGDIVILAAPMSAYNKLPKNQLQEKVVIDACNYYPERDGDIPPLQNRETTSSALIASSIKNPAVVKAFNCIVMTDMPRDARPSGAANRRALPFAGDDDNARQIVSGMIDAFGFEPVDAGPLSESWRFEPETPVYCVPLQAKELKASLDETVRS
ncbi:MAG: NAD(P)-binding domain-containing protein [Pseudomonadota bacterium]